MAFTFQGGIHPNGNKTATNLRPIQTLKAPEQVILPMSMHIGAPCEPIVNVGDIVDMGQMIAQSGAFVSAPIHATISGKVVAIKPMLHPNGAEVLSIVIENDYQDRLHSSVKPMDFAAMSNDERIEAIRTAGCVGHGGATFPTHVKIKSGIGKVDTVIINAAECEPYLTSDHRVLLESPEEVVGGLEMLVEIMGVKNAFIGIELNKKDAFKGIESLLKNQDIIKIAPLKPKYPQGSEKHLINAITGREVPSGKLPADAGCAVFNVDTAAAIYRRFKFGHPIMRRIVTVSGSAILHPKNLDTRIGTPVVNLIDACGGFKEPPNKLIMGGPMMGNAQFSLDVPVIKGTGAYLAFCEDEDQTVTNPTCIRCGKCIDVCPMNLAPCYLNIYGKNNDLEKCADIGMLDCIECGACAYECPARIPLVQQFRVSKLKIMNARRAAQAQNK